MFRESVLTSQAPAPWGTYPQAVKSGGLLFVSVNCPSRQAIVKLFQRTLLSSFINVLRILKTYAKPQERIWIELLK